MEMNTYSKSPRRSSISQIEGFSKNHDATQSKRKTKIAILNKGERYWIWKAAIRGVICVVSVVGIGCIGWLMSNASTLQVGGYGFGLGYGYGPVQPGALATLLVSILWCSAAITLPLIFKRTRPLHPGIAVGVDLLFWGGFLTLGFFTLGTVYEISFFGRGGVIYDPITRSDVKGYMGSYIMAQNGTWVYQITYVRGSNSGSYYNATTGSWIYTPVNTTGIVRSCTPTFSSCQEQDQWVNNLWLQKPGQFRTAVAVNVVTWLNLLLFMAVFIWACIDTHRYRARLTKTKEQIIADRIIADLERRGMIGVKDGVVQPYRTE